jgi:hypothetical protein
MGTRRCRVMDTKIMVILAVAIVLAVSLGVLQFPGAIYSQGVVQGVSKTTLNNKDAFVITMLGGGGADGLTAQVSKSQFPNWAADDSIFISVEKTDDKYVYTLTDRTGSNKGIYTLQEILACNGLDLWNSNACNNLNKPWRNMGNDLYSGFSQYCVSLNGTTTPVSLSADTLNPKFKCYQEVQKYQVGDFNYVGAQYKPKVLVTALTYKAGTQPWLDNTDYKKAAQLELSDSNPQGLLLADTGENLGEARITGMAPTFTSPPSSTAIKAITAPGTRNWQMVAGDIDSIYYSIRTTAPNSLQNCLKNAATSPSLGGQALLGLPTAASYGEMGFNTCINSYNAQINDIAANAPLKGDFARSDISLDRSAINTNGTISIKNSFALPSLTMWVYADQVGVVRQNAVPVMVSCDSIPAIGGGGSATLNARVSATGTGTIYWTASCTTPVTAQIGSGSVQASALAPFFVPINTGQATGVSTCTVIAKSTDLTQQVQGTCTVGVTKICTDPIPAGCHLAPTATDPCNIDCTVPPEICSDGTVLGACNSNFNRCVKSNGNLQLIADSSCGSKPPDNSTNSTCYPFVQKVNTQVVGGVNLFGWQIGGETVTNCVWDFPILGAGLLILAAILYKLRRVKEGKAVGIAGLLLIVLSFVADNALLLALGGTGIFLIAVVVVAAYIALRLGIL